MAEGDYKFIKVHQAQPAQEAIGQPDALHEESFRSEADSVAHAPVEPQLVQDAELPVPAEASDASHGAGPQGETPEERQARLRHERLMAKAQELERQESNLSSGNVPMSAMRVAIIVLGIAFLVLIVLWCAGVITV